MKSNLLIIFGLLCFTFNSCNSSDTSQSNQEQKTYKTVKIRNQVWLAENLNENKFRNGDPIYQAKSMLAWVDAAKNKKPAWSYYSNNESNETKYGKLYNWYAVSDTRGIAPDGYHIPSKVEFELLITNIGGESKNNFDDLIKGSISGFSARLGGYVGNLGNYECLNEEGYYWSASQADSNIVYCFRIAELFKQVHLSSQYGKDWGFSVRCIQN